MFLITGHPRSGTTYMWNILRASGVSVGGERNGSVSAISNEPPVKGVVSWLHIIDRTSRFDRILQQVRNPLDVISSAQTLSNVSLEFMFKILNAPRVWLLFLKFRRKVRMIENKKVALWTMYTWLKWNQMIERDSRLIYRYQVEKLEDEWETIAKTLGIKGQIFPSEVPKNVNTRKDSYKKVSLKRLYQLDRKLTDQLIRKAKNYGYTLDA
jgi:hypothetical protein